MNSTGHTDHAVAREELIRKLRDTGNFSHSTLAAFEAVPRHYFIDKALWYNAYDDITLPTRDGQTISQPTVVAQMTDLLDIKPNMKVLEIGTGSGFQAAILSQFTDLVYTIERVPSLAKSVRERFRSLGYNTIICREGDGTKGWPDKAPFDRIIVTAGAPIVPKSLLNQLAVGGKLVIPTGSLDEQVLELYTVETDKIVRQRFNTLLFVPLVGDEGWTKERK